MMVVDVNLLTFRSPSKKGRGVVLARRKLERKKMTVEITKGKKAERYIESGSRKKRNMLTSTTSEFASEKNVKVTDEK